LTTPTRALPGIASPWESSWQSGCWASNLAGPPQRAAPAPPFESGGFQVVKNRPVAVDDQPASAWRLGVVAVPVGQHPAFAAAPRASCREREKKPVGAESKEKKSQTEGSHRATD